MLNRHRMFGCSLLGCLQVQGYESFARARAINCLLTRACGVFVHSQFPIVTITRLPVLVLVERNDRYYPGTFGLSDFRSSSEVS